MGPEAGQVYFSRTSQFLGQRAFPDYESSPSILRPRAPLTGTTESPQTKRDWGSRHVDGGHFPNTHRSGCELSGPCEIIKRRATTALLTRQSENTRFGLRHLCCEVSTSRGLVFRDALFFREYTSAGARVCMCVHVCLGVHVYLCTHVNTCIFFTQLYHFPIFSYGNSKSFLISNEYFHYMIF